MNTQSNRRSFLLNVAKGAAAVSLPVLSACGGGGDPSTDPAPGPIDSGEPGAGLPPDGTGSPGGTPGGPSSAESEARQQVFASVEGVLSKVFNLPREAGLAQVLAAMKATNAYTEVGVEAESESAWGVFADGVTHIVALNRAPARTRELRAASGAVNKSLRVEAPQGTRAMVLHSFGRRFEGQDAVQDISAWLDQGGYRVLPTQEGNATLEVLRKDVKELDFFYFNTHGGRGGQTLFQGSGFQVYSIQSSTVVKFLDHIDLTIKGDLLNGRLTYFSAHNGEVSADGVELADTRYGITWAFVEQYWTFRPDSVVMINACSSVRVGSDWGLRFISACHNVKAGLVTGWTKSVSGGATGSAYVIPRYFVDRLLGANKFKPEPTPQRAFAHDLTIQDMGRKGLLLDSNTGAGFRAIPTPDAPYARILSPSIGHMDVNEYTDELRLYGTFGTRIGKVLVEGEELEVKAWANEEILCHLPVSGPGHAGAVRVVLLDQRLSNVRHLSEWKLPIDYRFAYPWQPGPNVTGKVDLTYRADVGRRRDAPGEDPKEAHAYSYPTRHSYAELRAAGSFPAGACNLTWSGSALYPAIREGAEPRALVAYMDLNPGGGRADLGLGLGSSSKTDFVTTCATSTPFAPGFLGLETTHSFASPVDVNQMVSFPSVKFDMNSSSYAIAGGKVKTQLMDLTWAPSEPLSPPLPASAV